jgi:hypothetical protein
MADEEIELHRALRDTQHQQVYFLLGAAGAAIALALNQTRDAALHWAHIPLALAIIAWGLSFYFGCMNRKWVAAGLHSNAGLYDVHAGRHPAVGQNREAMAYADGLLRGIFEDQSNKAKSTFSLQFNFLVGGAAFYLAWHVLQMYLRS